VQYSRGMTETGYDATTWQQIEQSLRQRDADPAYADAPVLDAYARISKSPEGDLEKTDRQLVDILNNIARRPARLGAVLRDDNLSAWRRTPKGRPGWNVLVRRLEARTSAGVVAWHTDRLMRQPRDLERLIDFGEKHGLTVGSCHGDYSLDDQDDLFTLRVLTAAASKASADTSRRQKRKAQSLRDAGRLHGGARPFGLPGKELGGKAPVQPAQIEREREAIASAIRSHLDGVSLATICREWNASGLRTTSGKPWRVVHMGRLLIAPRVVGLLVHKGVVVGKLADVEPIVSEDEWRAVVATFKSRSRGRPASDPYLLSGGHLRCGVCGERMKGKPQHRPGSVVRRYTCRDINCGGVSIDALLVEAEVRSFVLTELADPKHQRQIAQTSAKLAEAEKRLRVARDTVTELARRLGEGEMDLDAHDAAVAPLKRRITKLTAERDALLDAGAGSALRVANRAELATEWDDPDATADHRRRMIRRVAPRGFIVMPRELGTSRVNVKARLRVAEQ